MRPKTNMDRALMRKAQELVWDHVPEAVRYVAEVLADPMAERRDRLKAASMILERTIPTMQSVDVRAIVAAFGGDADTPESESKFSAQKRESVLRLLAMAHQVAGPAVPDQNGNGHP